MRRRQTALRYNNPHQAALVVRLLCNRPNQPILPQDVRLASDTTTCHAPRQYTKVTKKLQKSTEKAEDDFA